MSKTPTDVPETTLTLTKMEAAARQTEAAIEALIRGEFDIAITLAGAAEGMIDRDGPHMFAYLRDSPRTSELDSKKWIAALNLERDWLKHSGGPDSLSFERENAAYMIARAASKLEHWSPKMEAFKEWVLEFIIKPQV